MFRKQLAKLLGVRSLVTVLLVFGLLGMIFVPGINPPAEIMAVFCTTISTVVTFFFKEREKEDKKEEDDGISGR